jgi:H+/gluconate symporter-like permease
VKVPELVADGRETRSKPVLKLEKRMKISQAIVGASIFVGFTVLYLVQPHSTPLSCCTIVAAFIGTLVMFTAIDAK